MTMERRPAEPCGQIVWIHWRTRPSPRVVRPTGRTTPGGLCAGPAGQGARTSTEHRYRRPLHGRRSASQTRKHAPRDRIREESPELSVVLQRTDALRVVVVKLPADATGFRNRQGSKHHPPPPKVSPQHHNHNAVRSPGRGTVEQTGMSVSRWGGTAQCGGRWLRDAAP